MAPVAVGALVVMFFMAGHPERLHAWLLKAERVLPARHRGDDRALRADVRRRAWRSCASPRRLVAGAGLVAGAVGGRSPRGSGRCRCAFGIAMPFTGAWLMLALLVVGVAVPTPGGVGGFHEAFRLGATAFFGADNDAAVGAAIVLHAIVVRAGDARWALVRGAGRAEAAASLDRLEPARRESREVSLLRRPRRQGRRLAREPRRRRHPPPPPVPQRRVPASASPATSGSTRSRTWW